MAKRSQKNSEPDIRPRIRITSDGEVAIGPGKAELLAHLKTTGSLAQAARQMDMSYMRAWTLIKTMEKCFKAPLVTRARGGEGGGGATLTETGHEVLALYQAMEADAMAATQASWAKLKRLLR